MARMTRRRLLAAAGTTTVAERPTLLAKDGPTNNRRYHFQNISPSELIRQRHLPNVELMTQDGKKVHFNEAGSGTETLVMIHGGGPGASGWSNF